MSERVDSINPGQAIVSIIIPAYNAQHYVAQAIESALNQTYKNLEIVVVDDGSTDNTSEIVQAFPKIIYHCQQNQGVAAARNKAIDLCSGQYLCFLDADDIYLNLKVERQIKYLWENPEVDCCVSQLRNFFEEGCSVDKELENYFVNREQINISTIFMKRATFDRVGKFNVSYRTGSDFEWVTRAREIGLNIGIMEEVLTERRIHDTNLSVLGQAEDKAVRFRIIRESLARRRQQKS